MSSRLQLDVHNLSHGWRHLVNAYDVKAGIGVIAGKTVWSLPERLECEALQKEHYINTVTYLSTSCIIAKNSTLPVCSKAIDKADTCLRGAFLQHVLRPVTITIRSPHDLRYDSWSQKTSIPGLPKGDSAWSYIHRPNSDAVPASDGCT